MEKFTYRLVTQSGLIVSPRANTAFYEVLKKEVGNSSSWEIKADSNYLNKERLKVIYPFYQYGEYASYAPDSAEYYLPGSSIKGALLQGTRLAPGSFMVDDVSVSKDSIVLRNLYKAQHIKKVEDEKKAFFDVYFENIGVEMIKAGVELKGEFYLKDREMADRCLQEANQRTRAKITQMLEYLKELQKRDFCDKLLKELQEAEDNLFPLSEASDIFLMGGYKGLILSMNPESISQEMSRAVFLDPETMLPHGLVKLELV